MKATIPPLKEDKYLNSKFYQELTTLNSKSALIITKHGVNKLLNSLRKYVHLIKNFNDIEKEKLFSRQIDHIFIREIDGLNIISDPKHKVHKRFNEHLCPNCENRLIETGMCSAHDSDKCFYYMYCLNCMKSYRCYWYGGKKEEIKDINFMSERE